jgi:2-hydroxy-3-oxopropionate reductase
MQNKAFEWMRAVQQTAIQRSTLEKQHGHVMELRKLLKGMRNGPIKRNFEPGFPVEFHRKDLNLAFEGARQLNLALPNTTGCQELFNSAVAAGGARWDHLALVHVLEEMASHEIAKARG